MNITKKNIIVTIFLVMLLFCQPLYYSSKIIVTPILKEETRPLIGYYRGQRATEDKIYVYCGAVRAFTYYTMDSDEKFIKGISARSEPGKYLEELESLDGKGRIWFLFSHVYGDEKTIFINKLDELGQQLKNVKTTGASLYLYDI